MKFQSSLFAVFAFLLAVVSAETYKAVLKFHNEPTHYPQPYYTEIYIPRIGARFFADFWPTSANKYLTKVYPGYISHGEIEIDNVQKFPGDFKAVITDNTENLVISLSSPVQIVQFIGTSASDEVVANLKANAYISNPFERGYF